MDTRKLALVCLLLTLPSQAPAVTVATIGDSFADAFYLGMKARPDLVRQKDIVLRRWSRPIIGMVRSDYFDYPGWLRETDLGTADVCFVQIGANDMQSMPLAHSPWIAFGTAPWEQEYARRVRGVAETLQRRHCRQVLWILQPGFEKRAFLACHGATINQVQSGALEGTGIWLFRMITGTSAYGPDNTHFNGEFELALGQAAFRLVELHQQMAARRCLLCHPTLSAGKAIAEPEIYPLGFWRGGPSAPPRQIACAVPAPGMPVDRRATPRRGIRPVHLGRRLTWCLGLFQPLIV